MTDGGWQSTDCGRQWADGWLVGPDGKGMLVFWVRGQSLAAGSTDKANGRPLPAVPRQCPGQMLHFDSNLRRLGTSFVEKLPKTPGSSLMYATCISAGAL
mmetsp:Transcript_43752/g.71351  ORF Transcript_43752/g.71351 Transcript_43752/m.71351 type:complete len:100 (-) Transcript_43752:657-956(-)